MPIIHTGAYPTGMLSPQQKIKRAVSGYILTNTANDISPLMYTSTAITVTAVNYYVIDAIVGVGFKLDVGINADDDSIVDGNATGAEGAKSADAVVPVTINVSASVALGKVVTASVETQDGTSGTIQVTIEYVETDA